MVHIKELKGYRRATAAEFAFINFSRREIQRFKWLVISSICLVLMLGCLEYFFLDFGFGVVDGLFSLWMMIGFSALGSRNLPWHMAAKLNQDKRSPGYRIRLWQWWTSLSLFAIYLIDMMQTTITSSDFHVSSDIGVLLFILAILNGDAFSQDWMFAPATSKSDDNCFIVRELPDKVLFRWLYLGLYPERTSWLQRVIGNISRAGLAAALMLYLAVYAFTGVGMQPEEYALLRPDAVKLLAWFAIGSLLLLWLTFTPALIGLKNGAQYWYRIDTSVRDSYLLATMFIMAMFLPQMSLNPFSFGIAMYFLFQYLAETFTFQAGELPQSNGKPAARMLRV